MLKNDELVGVVVIYRLDVRPFSKKQIDLVTTFANQAAIAIENVRLFDEVQARTAEVTEALEYQTATSDVLNVISRSPSEVQAVFDSIVRTARRLCEAERASVLQLEDGEYRAVAIDGVRNPDFDQELAATPIAPDRSSITGVLSWKGGSSTCTTLRRIPSSRTSAIISRIPPDNARRSIATRPAGPGRDRAGSADRETLH